ncbi:MAG: hypothetical protein PHU46_12185 [Rhodocyclaceae bacterium]|nr:hypothetical protein [Rhodocyclaceae bacterium]
MENPAPETLPQAGGSYTRDPNSGALIPNTPPLQDAVGPDSSGQEFSGGLKPAPQQE